MSYGLIALIHSFICYTVQDTTLTKYFLLRFLEDAYQSSPASLELLGHNPFEGCCSHITKPLQSLYEMLLSQTLHQLEIWSKIISYQVQKYKSHFSKSTCLKASYALLTISSSLSGFSCIYTGWLLKMLQGLDGNGQHTLRPYFDTAGQPSTLLYQPLLARPSLFINIRFTINASECSNLFQKSLNA